MARSGNQLLEDYYRKERKPNKINKETRGNPERKIIYDERESTVLEILDGVIDNLDPVLMDQIYNSYEKDIDKLFDDIVREAYDVLYGIDSYTKIKPSISYLSEINNVLNEELRKTSLSYFASDALGMMISPLQIEWAWLIENFLKVAILAPRDHGKSFWFSHALPIWKAYRYDANSTDPLNYLNKKTLLFSNSSPQAYDLIEIIKDSVEEHETVRERLYPDKRETWSKTSLKFKNGARIKGKGFGNSVRGAHVGTVIVDDGLKDNVLYSATQRERNKDYFRAVISNLVIPKGQLLVVGTPFHEEDLYSIFRDSIDFAYREYPAIDKKGNILWPERYDAAALEEKKRLNGSILFTREYLCKPVSNSMTLFPDKILKRSTLGMSSHSFINSIDGSKIQFKRVITGCDFAISSETGADYNVFMTGGIDEYDNLWLLDIYRAKGIGYVEQKRALRNIWRKFHPDIMLLESNQFQRLYTDWLKDETDMPVKPFHTTARKNSLEEGIPSLVIMFENGKIRVPYQTDEDQEKAESLFEELQHIGFTEKGIQGVGSHDDQVMALWLLRQAMIYVESEFMFDMIGVEAA